MHQTLQQWQRWQELELHREQVRLLAKGNARLDILQSGLATVSSALASGGPGLAHEVESLRGGIEWMATVQGSAFAGLQGEVSAGMSAISGELQDGFSSLNTVLSGLDDTLRDGLAEVTRILAEMNQKMDYSDEFRRFLSFKKNAFELVPHGQLVRAIEQGVAGLTLSDGRGTPDDRIARDPELSALVARLLLIINHPTYAGPPIETLAENARGRGPVVGTRSSVQAAAVGCAILSMAARSRRDLHGAEKMAIQSHNFEQFDRVASAARYMAAKTASGWLEPDPDIGNSTSAELDGGELAAHAVASPRFVPLWLMEPATSGAAKLAEAMATEASDQLRAWLDELASTAHTRARFWGIAYPELGAVVRQRLASTEGTSTATTLIDLAHDVRLSLRRLSQGERSLATALATACRERCVALSSLCSEAGRAIDARWDTERKRLEAALASANRRQLEVSRAWFALASTKARAAAAVSTAEAQLRSATAHHQAVTSELWSKSRETEHALKALARELDQHQHLWTHGAAIRAWAESNKPVDVASYDALVVAIPTAWTEPQPPLEWNRLIMRAHPLLAWSPDRLAA